MNNTNLFSTVSNNLIAGNNNIHKENLIIPYIKECIFNERNIVVLDLNKSLLKKCGKYISELGYTVELIDATNPKGSDLWNPLLVPYYEYKDGNIDECLDELYNIATIIMSDEIKIQNKDPYWENTSIDYFVGLSLILFSEAKNESQINTTNIYYMAKSCSEKFGGSTYLKEYISEMEQDPYGISKILQSVIVAPSETKASIEAVFYQKLNILNRQETIFNALGEFSINLDNVCCGKTAIFLNYSDDKTVDLPYIKIFLSQLFHTIKNHANYDKSVRAFNFIFKDFLSLGYVAEIERMISANNKINNYFLVDIDSLSYAERLYGDNFSEYLIAMCEGIVVMPTTEIKILSKVSELYNILAENNNKWVSPYYLQRDTALFLLQACDPRVIHIKEIEYDEEYVYNAIIREKYQIEEFDLKELVRDRKKQRLIRMMNENAGDDMISIEKIQEDDRVNNLEIKDESSMLMDRINKKISDLYARENLNRLINDK